MQFVGRKALKKKHVFILKVFSAHKDLLCFFFCMDYYVFKWSCLVVGVVFMLRFLFGVGFGLVLFGVGFSLLLVQVWCSILVTPSCDGMPLYQEIPEKTKLLKTPTKILVPLKVLFSFPLKKKKILPKRVRILEGKPFRSLRSGKKKKKNGRRSPFVLASRRSSSSSLIFSSMRIALVEASLGAAGRKML